jgi:PKD repeat protein
LRTQDSDSTDAFVLNADGYTTLFNPTDYPEGTNIPLFTYSKGAFATAALPDSTLNPFLDYYTDDDRHFFRAGESVMRTWQIKMPSGGPFVLGYAVDACWELPDPNPPVDIPGDFPIAANRPEAYNMEISLTQNLGTDVGSQSEIRVRVQDWDMTHPPSDAKVECPELWTGSVNSYMSAVGLDNIIFYITIENETGALTGIYHSLVTVVDDCPAQPTLDCNSYRLFDIEVGQVNHAPHAAAEAEQYTAYIGEQIQFHSLATDPDGVGDIEEYLWDFDNDGNWDFMFSDTSWAFQAAGTYHVDHKVTDYGGLWDDLEPDELLEVTIFDPCCDNPPVAAAHATQTSVLVGEIVTLTSLSYDPDGDECLDELGWDYDADPDIDQYGAQIQVAFFEPGLYEVQHQATDTCGLSDWLDEPIIIEVSLDCCTDPPVAVIDDPPTDVVTDMEVALTSLSYDPESPYCPVEEAWDLDDDGEFDDAFGTEANISWPDAGVYNVSLEVTDDCDLTDVVTIPITVHIGVLKPEDQDYRTIGTKYSYVSADLLASSAASFVDLTDTDGPWDFTGLPLTNTGNYRAILAENHPEVTPFADDFIQTVHHFYKTEGIYNIVSGAVYVAETYISAPDALLWVGIHEDTTIGSVNLSPTVVHEYPYWIFSEIHYHYGLPIVFEMNYDLIGWGEGIVKVPYYGTEQFSLILAYEIRITSPTLTGSVLAFEWLLDDGTVVAIVAAINMGAEINYDPDTWEITGTATYNALSNIGPYD